MGGIAIRTNTKNVNLGETLSNLFNTQFIQMNEYCDCRLDEYFYVSKNENFLVIYNSSLVEEIFQNNPSREFQRIYDYFNQSDLIFAFQEYTHSDTYSYAIFENGQLVRKCSYSDGELLINEGNLFPIEIKWKNAKSEMEYDDDEELGLIYFDPDDEDVTYTEEEVPKVILYELMTEKLGFDGDSEFDIKIEDGYFKKTSK